MKTINFNKRILAKMAIALLCGFTAKAQDTKEWSIIPSAKTGITWVGSTPKMFGVDVYDVHAGVEATVSFNKS